MLQTDELREREGRTRQSDTTRIQGGRGGASYVRTEQAQQATRLSKLTKASAKAEGPINFEYENIGVRGCCGKLRNTIVP